MNWDIYYNDLIASNGSRPEQILLCAMFERTLRDIGVLDGDSSVTYYSLRDACDYIFDEPSGSQEWTFRWLLQNINGIVDEEKIIIGLREYILEHWTNKRVRRLIYGRRRIKKTS